MSPAATLEALRGKTVSTYDEALAFEWLYSREGMTLKKLADMTVKADKLPSVAMSEYCGLLGADGMDEIEAHFQKKLERLPFQVAVKGTTSWPDGISDSARPTPVLYFCGDLDLLDTDRVSVVGSRKATDAGLARAARIGRELAEAGVTVVSGLAKGIDTAAMTAALNTNADNRFRRGRVIGVIGTPLDEQYPRENAQLQYFVASYDLLLSQVPFYRYSVQPFNTRRYYFPERNELMAAVSQATVIVEASDTSGTLAQARACLHQHRPLFIARSCVENEAVTWPRKWAARPGVFVLDDVSQVIDAVRS